MEAEARKVMGRLNPNFRRFKEPVIALSGGQRQSVAIARAIHFNARILIMDEPTASLSERDGLLVLSVGGGDAERGVSGNLVSAMELARARRASIFAIVGRDGGFAAKVADSIVLIPPLYPERVTPHTEGLCAVIWHLLVTHPLLARRSAKWEELK